MKPDSPEAKDPGHEGFDPKRVAVTFHATAHGGEAVGRLPDGRAVFVAGAIAGERAWIRVRQQKRSWARGELLELIESHPERQEPPCPHFDRCGGCQWQHISLSHQRQLKRDIVAGQLRHLGRMESPRVEDVIHVGPEDGFGYRNHVVFRIDPAGRCCLHRSGSSELVPIDRCALLHPLLQEWHRELPLLPGAERLELRAGIHTGQRLAILRGQPPPEALADAMARGIPLRAPGESEIAEMVNEERLRISSKSFFQVNSAGAARMVELILDILDPGDQDTVADLYAGVGLFSVPLARRASRVFAVERNAAAVRDLRHHARALRGKIHVIGTAVGDAFSQLPNRVDLIVADPPREGLGNEIAVKLCTLGARRLALVSCDPAALARDARALVDHGYQLRRSLPVDLFPHTFHVECIGVFERR